MYTVLFLIPFCTLLSRQNKLYPYFYLLCPFCVIMVDHLSLKKKPSKSDQQIVL